MTDYRKKFVATTMTLLGVILLIGFLVLSVLLTIDNYHSLHNTMQQVVQPLSDFGNADDRQSPQVPAEANGTFKPGPPQNETNGSFEPGSQQRETPDSPTEEEKQAPFGTDSSTPPKKPTGDGPPEGAPSEPSGDTPLAQDQTTSKDYNYSDANNRFWDYHITTVFYHHASQSVMIISENTEFEKETIHTVVPLILDQDKSFGFLKGYGIIYYTDSEETTSRIALTASTTFVWNAAATFGIILLIYFCTMAAILPICIRLSKTAAKPMENAIRMERQFVANISHDLKTPVTVIMANNSIMRGLPDTTESHRQWLDNTDTAAGNMISMLEEMLTLSSLEEQPEEKLKETVNFSDVLEKCELQMEGVAYERSISMKTEIVPQQMVRAKKEYAERICNVLLDNALKYEPSGGSVFVSLRPSKRNVILTIQNAGSFIEEKDLPHIFERFYRADAARNLKKGHGLGLPIVKQLCDMIGAKIDVASDRENGTVFSVQFENMSDK